MVVIHEDDKPRGLWRLGRITKLITGKDGHVRAAVLRVSKDCSLQRPIQKLFPLEIAQQRAPETTTTADEAEPQHEDSREERQDKVDSRPQRAAAVDARRRLAAYAALDSDDSD